MRPSSARSQALSPLLWRGEKSAALRAPLETRPAVTGRSGVAGGLPAAPLRGDPGGVRRRGGVLLRIC